MMKFKKGNQVAKKDYVIKAWDNFGSMDIHHPHGNREKLLAEARKLAKRFTHITVISYKNDGDYGNTIYSRVRGRADMSVG